MNRRARAFLAHLLHRRCSKCYADGFYDAARLAEQQDRLRVSGFSDIEAERLLDIRLRAR